VVGLELVAEIGFQLGSRFGKRVKSLEKGMSALVSSEGTLLTLLSLLLGFGISMAESRNTARIERMLNESDAISTAYNRTEFTSGTIQAPLKDGIRRFLDLRIRFYRLPFEDRELEDVLRQTDQVEDRIWAEVRRHVSENPRSSTNILLANSINEMFDARSQQDGMFQIFLPRSLTILLLVSSVLVIGLMGYRHGLEGARHLVFTGILTFVFATTLFVLVDLNRPRRGIIHVSDRPLVELQDRLRRSP
jgi:hypothetical protein